MQPDELEAVADVVAQAIRAALAPVLERLAVVEARLEDQGGEAVAQALGPIRERLAVVETKALQPSAADPLLDGRIYAVDTRLTQALERVAVAETRLATLEQTGDKDASRLEGYTAALQRDAVALVQRVAALETRPLVPGPQGEPGTPGKDGTHGKDGTAGLSFEGVYQDGQSYDKGALVTWAGSSWHCNEATTTKPGDGSKDWTLMVKRGRDGRDGKDAPGALPVVRVGEGRV